MAKGFVLEASRSRQYILCMDMKTLVRQSWKAISSISHFTLSTRPLSHTAFWLLMMKIVLGGVPCLLSRESFHLIPCLRCRFLNFLPLSELHTFHFGSLFFFYSFFPSYFSAFSYYWGLFHLMHLRARFSSRCTSPSSITLSVRADKHLPTDEARRREERKAQVEQLWRIDTGQGGGITRCRKITPTLAYMP